MLYQKYPERDGITVYTPIKTWSKERSEEYKLRKWEPINKTAKEVAQ